MWSKRENKVIEPACRALARSLVRRWRGQGEAHLPKKQLFVQYYLFSQNQYYCLWKYVKIGATNPAIARTTAAEWRKIGRAKKWAGLAAAENRNAFRVGVSPSRPDPYLWHGVQLYKHVLYTKSSYASHEGRQAGRQRVYWKAPASRHPNENNSRSLAHPLTYSLRRPAERYLSADSLGIVAVAVAAKP